MLPERNVRRQFSDRGASPEIFQRFRVSGQEMHQARSQGYCEKISFHFRPLFVLVYSEFAKIARATGIGFLIMGFIGFFVKLVHIPINNIIVGGM